MVVHREPEQDREQEQREPRLDRVALVEVEPDRVEEADPHALLEHERHGAVGGAHRQQVHDDRLDRHDDRPEHDHQQQERQPQHEREHDPLVGVGHVQEVRRRWRWSRPRSTWTPVTPANAAGTASSRRSWIAAIAASFCVSALEEGGRPRSPTRPWTVATWVCGANAGFFAISDCRFFIAAWTCGFCTSPVTMINAGIGQPAGELLLEREERRLGRHVGELVDVGRAPLVHLEVEGAETRQDQRR